MTGDFEASKSEPSLRRTEEIRVIPIRGLPELHEGDDLAAHLPGPEATEIAGEHGDPRHLQVVLDEAREIVRRRGAFLVCET